MEKLKIFCGHDQLRPAFTQLQQYNEYVYATDSYALAMKKGKLPDDPNRQTINGGNHVLQDMLETEYKLFRSMTREEFNDYVKQFPLVQIFEDCEQCEGTGSVECQLCNHEDECEECGGSGNGEFIEFSYATQSTLELDYNVWVNPHFISKTFEMNEEIKIFLPLDSNLYKAVKIEAGEYIIFLMRKLSPNEHNVKILCS